jgi:hypothetical protein
VAVPTLSTHSARRWDTASKMTAPWRRSTKKANSRALQRGVEAAAAREAAAHAQAVLKGVTGVVYRRGAVDARVERPT